MVEHRFGVRPLLDAFFAEGTAAAGAEDRLGSLGLFTPSPAFRWGAVTVAGESAGESWLLRGRVRASNPLSAGSLVLARLPDLSLVWVDHNAPNAYLRDGWLLLEGAPAGPVSRPLTAADLQPHLEAYAGRWALAAAACAGQGVRALRRAARTTAVQGEAFSASQIVALDIAAVEIEAELVSALLREPAGSGREDLARAVAAARLLSAVEAVTVKLHDQAGLEVDGPFADGAAKVLAALLGGPLMLEAELSHALGIPDGQEKGG
jgi:hypothetical protein